MHLREPRGKATFVPLCHHNSANGRAAAGCSRGRPCRALLQSVSLSGRLAREQPAPPAGIRHTDAPVPGHPQYPESSFALHTEKEEGAHQSSHVHHCLKQDLFSKQYKSSFR
ncbi:hypothetical protein Y1Q_0002372 [Alligator mississippiensis]|uniref:Uncharacterized protein n=1 Tax=Alligator mississippiensis TaxID=8496 RepID=A0A151MGX4_ALLMI|nr:hypothetical protein Y1Q_0002372 [Alligator mississippiensis]